MGYYDNDDINSIMGNGQLNSDDDDITNTLNGDYDDIMEESSVESMMDADEDLEDIGAVDYSDEEIAQMIVNESQGVDEHGQPCAAVSLSIDMINSDLTKRRTVANHAMFRPVITINRRMEFIEIVMTFPSAIDSNIKVSMFNLDKFGSMLDEVNEASTECPIFSAVILPTTGLGCYYMIATNPVFWSLNSDKAGEQPKQIKMLFKCEDVGFFQTDEMDMTAIDAEIQREQAAEEAAYDYMMQKEEEKRQQTRVNDIFAAMQETEADDDDDDDEDVEALIKELLDE